MLYRSTNRFSQKIALALAWIMLFQAFMPLQALALTSGPSQPEFNSFEPVGTTQMVDPFSGSFVYNIPLFELPGPNGGYPFNLSYKPEGGMDAESGPFGMGWTINPGIITRNVRGIPDDASGESTTVTTSIKDNWTAGVDVSGGDLEGLGLSVVNINAGLGVYYNSYRGVGVNASLGLSLSMDKMNSSVGVGLSVDSQEGFGLSPSLTLGGIFSASTSINGRRGMSGLALSLQVPGGSKKYKHNNKPYGRSFSVYGASISLGNAAQSPSLDLPWNSVSVSGKVKLGGSVYGVFGNGEIGGSFSRQKLANKGEPVTYPSYGFLNLEKVPTGDAGKNAMLDFTREKDGPIREFSPNLGIPSTSPDIYTAVGQGMAGMFRPFRSDIGVLYDPEVISEGGGGSFSFDAPILHAGGSGNLSFNTSNSGKWENDLTNAADFQSAVADPLYEPYYFKTQGEKISESRQAIDRHIGGEEAMRPVISQGNASASYVDEDNQITGVGMGTDQVLAHRTDLGSEGITTRKPRGLAIQDFTNQVAGEISLLQNDYFLEEVDLGDFVNGGLPNTTTYDHGDNPADQLGGFISTDTKGVRYVYGIPAYNNVKEEYIFSVDKPAGTCNALVDVIGDGAGEVDYEIDDTDKYLKKTEHPQFAHSFLLTTVLGADYIDVDNNGPSVNDLGYWVKFNYAKIHDHYSWRSPYHQAFYDAGIRFKDDDDKGSFSYGEKEIWMLGTVETKSHVAVFLTEEREDGLDAPGKIANTGMGNHKLHAVKEIRLYTRSAFESGTGLQSLQPLRTVHFAYDYSISENVPNAVNGKKMALKEVWFTSENSIRGAANKYEFDYGTDEFNPPYSATGFDRWGTFVNTFDENDNLTCGNLDFPYTPQYPYDPADLQMFKDTMNENASAWHLKEITMPSGSKIKVDWEAKTYAHVQDRLATQMVKMASLKTVNTTTGAISNILESETHNGEDHYVKIYFKPELDPNENNDPYPVENYLEDLHIGDTDNNYKQVYYKARVRLFKNGGSNDPDYVNTAQPDLYQDVSGYLNVIEAVDDYSNSGHYYLKCEKLKKKNGTDHWNYHPISMAAWHFMKLQLPEFLLQLPQMPEEAAEGEGKGLVKKMIGSLGAIISFFGGFYNSCHGKNFANRIDQNHSYIKLTCPDKEKYGGGARVAQITLEEEWDIAQTGGTSYGQKYDYAGGVTPNEPAIGNDENALRYGKVYPNTLLMASDEYYFFEYPVNENLYPGPSVGYGKVEVKSLATHLAELKKNGQSNGTDDLNWLPDGISTTGKVVHEFYTAKDFPVVTDETSIKKIKRKQLLPLFPMGNMNSEQLTASQGFSITKNDMHGKAKMVSNFAQDIQGNFLDNPYNWVKYNYKHKAITHKGRDILVLDNEVEVLTDYEPTDPDGDETFEMPSETRLVGVDYEMVNDMRKKESFMMYAGGQFNIDFTPFPPGFPLPSFWPTVSFDEVYTETAATNKMIFKSGIMESAEAFDGSSQVLTKNLLYDPLSGSPLLTEVTNSYGDPIYNLNVPAHMVYDGMGAAYENMDMSFAATPEYNASCGLFKMDDLPTEIESSLVPGDEFLLGESTAYDKGEATFVRTQDGEYWFDIDYEGTTFPLPEFDFLCVRSGKRNQLGASVGSMAGLDNPVEGIGVNNCDLSVEVGSYVINNPECVYFTERNDLFIDLINLMLNEDADDDGIDDFFEEKIDLINDDFFKDFAPYQDIINSIPGFAEYLDNFHYKFNGVTGPHLFHKLGDGGPLLFFSSQPCENYNTPFNYMPNLWPELKSVSRVQECSTCYFPKPSGLVNFMLESGDETLSISGLWGYYLGFSLSSPDDIIITTETIPIDQYTQKNLLAINTSTFSDTWETGSTGSSNNPYATGEKGIWRAEAGYAYVDKRIQNGTGDVGMDLRLDKDGILDTAALFDYNNPFFADCDDSKWQRTSLATQYSGENALESKDAIGVYSSALYGYENTLPIAVANNARNKEIAFEGFEEFASTDLNTLSSNDERNSGHFDIFNMVTDPTITYESFELISGKANTIIVDKPFVGDWVPEELKINIQLQDGTDFYVNATPMPGLIQKSDAENTLIVLQYEEGCEPSIANGNFEDEIWKGTLYAKKSYLTNGLNVDLGSGDIEVCESCLDATESLIPAHSGKRFLKFPQNTISELTIKSLNLVDAKKYLFSAWVRRDYMHPENMPNTVRINSEEVPIVSDVINGWVKVEKVFTTNNSEVFLQFYADPIPVYNAQGELTNQSSPLYLDDIRLQPMESSMATHVYDPVNYRLVASLDENNFATFYEYDEEGRLTTLKKETERGIKTIQNNQSYLATQPD